MAKGLVSVIIPYYRKKNFFLKAFNSAYKQSYTNKEIIIIYDDPEKRDLNYIKKVTNKKKNVRIYINKFNLGAGRSRNKGLKKSKGDFIAFLDSDDLWHKNKLKVQIEYMKKNKFFFSFTSYQIIAEDNKIIGYRKAQKELIYKDLIHSCDIGLSTVILKKSLINKTILFPDLKTKEDYVLWLLISKKKIKLHGLKKNLVSWRKTRNSLSSNTAQKLIDGFRVYHKYMRYNIIKSLIYLLILSFNYLKKN